MKNNNTHLMIDLETLSTAPNAVVLTVGALWFDPYSDADPGPGFHLRVKVDNQDRHISDDTLAWWSGQSQEVQDAAFGDEDRVEMSEVLTQLSDFAKGADSYWAHGTVFDIGILENCYTQMNLFNLVPWKYYQVRDCRTVIKIANQEFIRTDGAHNALIDCWDQAISLQLAFKKLGLRA